MSVVSETVPPQSWSGVFYFRLQNRMPKQFGARGKPPAWLAYDHCHQRIGTVPFGWGTNVNCRVFGVSAKPAEMAIKEINGKTYAVAVGELVDFEKAIAARVWE